MYSWGWFLCTCGVSFCTVPAILNFVRLFVYLENECKSLGIFLYLQTKYFNIGLQNNVINLLEIERHNAIRG